MLRRTVIAGGVISAMAGRASDAMTLRSDVMCERSDAPMQGAPAAVPNTVTGSAPGSAVGLARGALFPPVELYNSDPTAISPDGNWIAVAPERRVEIWDVRAQTKLEAALRSVGTDSTFAFSPDSRFLAIGSFRTCRVLDLAHGRILWSVRNERLWWDVQALAYSADGSLLAAVGEGLVALLDSGSGRILHQLSGLDEYASACAFSQGLIVAGPGERGEIVLWDTASLTEVRRSTDKTGGRWSSLSLDHQHIVSAHRGHLGIRTFPALDLVRRIAVGFDTYDACLVGADRSVVWVQQYTTPLAQLYDWRSGEKIAEVEVGEAYHNRPSAFPDDRILAGRPLSIWTLLRA